MKLKEFLEQLFRGWVPVEAKMPKKWWTNNISITIFILVGFSFMIFVLLNSSIIVLNGSSSIRWSQTYEELRCYNSLVETSDGGFAFISETLPTSPWNIDFLLIKTNESGNIMWNKTFENTSDFVPSKLIEASDGGFVLCGYSSEYGYDPSLAKTDSVGNLLWTRTYDIDADGYTAVAFLIVETSDGGFALGGQAGTNFWLAKIDGSGNMLWSQTYGGPNFECPGSLVETSDGGFALAGMTKSYGTYSSFWLVRTDGSGNMLWNQTYGGGTHQGYLQNQRVIALSDGGFFLGSSVMQFDGNVDFWFAKTDAVGNIKWEKTHNEGTNEYLQSLVITSDGGLILAGTKSEFEPEKEILVPKVLIGDGLLVRIDNSGNMIWNQTYPGTGSTQNSNFLIKTSDGGYILLGNKLSSLGSFDFPLCDAYIAKIEEDQIVQEIVFPNLIILVILVVFVIGALGLLVISKITKRKNLE